MKEKLQEIQFGFRLGKEEHESLKAYANYYGLSVAGVVRIAIKDFLQKEEVKATLKKETF